MKMEISKRAAATMLAVMMFVSGFGMTTYAQNHNPDDICMISLYQAGLGSWNFINEGEIPEGAESFAFYCVDDALNFIRETAGNATLHRVVLIIIYLPYRTIMIVCEWH